MRIRSDSPVNRKVAQQSRPPSPDLGTDAGPQSEQRVIDLETLQVLLDHAGFSILLIDVLSGRIIDANSSACRLLGASHKDLLIRTFADVAGPSLSNQLKPLPAEAGETSAGIRTITAVLSRQDGQSVPVEMTLHQASLAGEDYMVAMAREGHSPVQAGEPERQGDEKYRSLINNVVDSSSVGVLFLDGNLRAIRMNQVLEHYLELRQEDVAGRNLQDLMQGPFRNQFEEPERFARKVFSTYDEDTSFEKLEVHILPAGAREERWLEHWSQPIRTGVYAGGRIEYFYDTTKRKRAEKALVAEEEKYRDLVQNANSIIMRRDRCGRVTFFNEYAQQFFGYREDEILGRHVVGTIVPEQDSSGQDLTSMIRDIGERPERYAVNENENRCKDGRRVWIAWTNKAMRDDKGQVLEILCVGNDITERKKLHKQLIHLQKMEAVSRLAAGIAHDFNNLLTAIIGCSDLMLMSLDKDDPIFRRAEQIKKTGERGASLTRQLLELGHKPSFLPKLLDLNDIIANQEKILRRMIGKDIELVSDLGRKIGKVRADPDSLEQVLLNLVVNAQEAMPNGGKITIRTDDAEPVADAADGTHVMLEISDTGTGMSEETRANIFEPFFTTKEVGKGVGMGLSTVYGIVKQCSGHIQTISEPGRGTTFRIFLPEAADQDPREQEHPLLPGISVLDVPPVSGRSQTNIGVNVDNS